MINEIRLYKKSLRFATIDEMLIRRSEAQLVVTHRIIFHKIPN